MALDDDRRRERAPRGRRGRSRRSAPGPGCAAACSGRRSRSPAPKRKRWARISFSRAPTHDQDLGVGPFLRDERSLGRHLRREDPLPELLLPCLDLDSALAELGEEPLHPVHVAVPAAPELVVGLLGASRRRRPWPGGPRSLDRILEGSRRRLAQTGHDVHRDAAARLDLHRLEAVGEELGLERGEEGRSPSPRRRRVGLRYLGDSRPRSRPGGLTMLFSASTMRWRSRLKALPPPAGRTRAMGSRRRGEVIDVDDVPERFGRRRGLVEDPEDGRAPPGPGRPRNVDVVAL